MLALLRNYYYRDTLLLYSITFFIILPYTCHDVKHSIFFQQWTSQEEGKAFLKAENGARLQEAKTYLEGHHHNGYDVFPTRKGRRNTIINSTITVVTHSRTRYFNDHYNPGYLTQTVAKLIRLSEKEIVEGNIINLFICNVDPDPNFNKEALELGDHVKLINRFSQLTLPLVHPKEKEKQDYLFCLNKSIGYESDYVFVVEDDAYPSDDTLSVFKHVIKSHMFSPDHDHGSVSKDTAYIKFYHPERLLGFLSFSPERIPELLAMSVLMSSLCTCLYFKFLRRSLRHDIYPKMLYIMWLNLMVYFLLVQLAIGRSQVDEWRKIASPYLYSLVPAPSCCTQAILYPRQRASELVKYMDSKTCDNNYAKDHIIEEFTQERRLKAYLVQPNVFTHIGLYSALRNQIVDPYML